MVRGTEFFRRRRIFYDGANLGPHEISRRLIGCCVRIDIIEGVDEIDATHRPAAFIFGDPLSFGNVERALACKFVKRTDLTRPRPPMLVLGFPRFLFFLGQRTIARRDDEIRSSQSREWPECQTNRCR